jgi:hypothetical protein
MVSYALIVASLAALTTSMFQVFKPRLPPYSLQIIKIPVPSIIGGEVMTRLSAKVRLHNDNFIGIDVHSLAVDMFYPDWSGELTHIGRVYDRKIQHSTQECLSDSACRKDKGLDLPVWALQPRADFQITDNVFALMKPSGLLKTIASIVWNSIKGRGSLVIPTTGVMQVKASSSTPVTMSMICDNSLNLWTLVMVGVECSLNSLDIGWLGIDGTIDKLQLEVLSTLQANATGGVLESHRPRGIGKKNANFEKALKEANSSSLMKG